MSKASNPAPELLSAPILDSSQNHQLGPLASSSLGIAPPRLRRRLAGLYRLVRWAGATSSARVARNGGILRRRPRRGRSTL